MEVLTGALTSVITKLSDLLIGEYKLQKGVKGEIVFLKAELESMKVALDKMSETPRDQVDKQDKIWARDLRELSYDIEDSIDTFMVRGEDNEPARPHGIKNFINRSINLFKTANIRHKIAIEIQDIRIRVEEVSKRHKRYRINNDAAKGVKVDPRLLAQFTKVTDLVGIDEARDELIKILMEGNQVSKQQGNIVSIFGFGGLGKTTLANAVYQKLRMQFDCWTFVSVSQTPDMMKVFKGMLSELGKTMNEEILNERRLIDLLRDFLQDKRYFIIIDDIWDINYWKMIKCALPDGNSGHRIIITTRNFTIAEQIGGAYKMKGLSVENSRILFYRRIFGNENNGKCPDEQLAEVSDRILKKAGGVPLAINTIASLLASKGMNKIEWYDLCNSIGSGLADHSQDVENMRKILSLSYYDLPSHLRSCLLYLCVFPEDYEIGKDRLIWMWIAEGFIQCEKQGVWLFELGESYFNELINRSMIQPIYKHNPILVMSHCRVHDMVLDLIRSLSSDENFVTILNDVHNTSPSEKIRRLSHQNGKENHNTGGASMSRQQQVRSIVVFRYFADMMLDLGSFRVLRVLDLEDCALSRDSSLKYLGNLILLRYLGLRNTRIGNLPDEVENLKFLQILDVRDSRISSLPSTVSQLRHLMCLRIDDETTVPNGIRSLTCLEELLELSIHVDSKDDIEGLGHLIKLKAMYINFRTEWNESLDKSVVECLQKLQKLRTLFIWVQSGGCNLNGWVAPPHLRTLGLAGCWFSTLPAWVNPFQLPDLSILFICVKVLQQEEPEMLRRLPGLRYLDLTVEHVNPEILERFAVGAYLFTCLVHCAVWGFSGPVVFQQGVVARPSELGPRNQPLRYMTGEDEDSDDVSWADEAQITVVPGECMVQPALTPEVVAVLNLAVSLARKRGSAQVTPVHLASVLLKHASTGFFRAACLRSHTHPLQIKALELCFSVAINRLPASTSLLGRDIYYPPSLSNALVAAINQQQMTSRRGSVDTHQQPVLAVTIGLQQLVISLLDDPSVSRVMREAGFSSAHVKANLEKAA